MTLSLPGRVPSKKKLSPAAKAFRKVKAETAQTVKERIQALLRELAIVRDGGCILRHYPQAGTCGGYAPKSGHLILQAEHLVTRGKSVAFGDTRNIVCLCLNHHHFFKARHSRLYWELIEKHIGPARWKLVKLWEADNRSYPMGKHDWLLVEIALEKELTKYTP